MLDRILALAGFALFVWYTAFAAGAQFTTPEVRAATDCPEGTFWSESQKKCVRIPRGSHGGTFEGN